jgi:putative membrane protein
MWSYGMGAGMVWWMWVVMGLGTIGFWLLVAYLVRMVMDGGSSRAAGPRVEAPEPLRLLDERLARGEIDAEEYQRTRNMLTHAH